MASYDITNAAVRLVGPWSYSYLNGQRVVQPVGLNAQMEFVANGTACTVRYAVEATGTNYLQASVDGGAFTNLTGPGSVDTFTDVTVFTGLSAGNHSVVIRAATGTLENVEFQATNGITITGGTEAISAPTDAGELSCHAWGTGRGKLQLCGLGTHNVSGGWPRLVLTRQDASLCFTSDATSIKIYAANNSAKARLYQDGVAAAAAVTLNSGNIYEWYTLASGLSGTHEYHVVNCLNATELRIGQVLAVGGTMSAPPWRPNIVGYGHSKVASNITTGLATTDLGWLWQLGVSHGYGVINQGVSARKIVAVSATETSHLHEDPTISYTRYDPDDIPYVFVLAGHNDNALANSNPTDFEWAVTRWLNRLREFHEGAQIYVLGELNTTAFSTGIRDAMNLAISNAVTAVGDPLMDYVDTDGWIDPATDTSDGTHLNTTGVGKVVTEIDDLNLLPDYAAPAGGGTTGRQGLHAIGAGAV